MSLLLDALKQAEKSKQDQAKAPGAGPGEAFELEQRPPESPQGGDTPSPEGEEERTGELAMTPLDQESPSGPEPGPDAPPPPASADLSLEDTAPRTRPRPEAKGGDSASMELDLDALAERLTDATGRFQGRDETQDLQPPGGAGAGDPGTATMPSMKSVQESLREFYDGTGTMESPTGAYAKGGQPAGGSDSGATTQEIGRASCRERVYTKV